MNYLVSTKSHPIDPKRLFHSHWLNDSWLDAVAVTPPLTPFPFSLSQSVLDLKIKSTIKSKTIRLNFDLVAKIFYLLLCWKFIQRGNRYDKHFRWTLPFYLVSSKLWVWSYGNMPTSVSRGELPRRERPGLRKLKYIPISYIVHCISRWLESEYWILKKDSLQSNIIIKSLC